MRGHSNSACQFLYYAREREKQLDNVYRFSNNIRMNSIYIEAGTWIFWWCRRSGFDKDSCLWRSFIVRCICVLHIDIECVRLKCSDDVNYRSLDKRRIQIHDRDSIAYDYNSCYLSRWETCETRALYQLLSPTPSLYGTCRFTWLLYSPNLFENKRNLLYNL